MALLIDYTDESALTGWTTVIPGGGNTDVVATGGFIKSYKLIPTHGNGFNVLGGYRTTGITGAANQVIYWQGKTISCSDCMWMIQKTGQITYNSGNPAGIYFEGGGSVVIRNGNSGSLATGKTWADNTLYDFRAIISTNGTISFSYRLADSVGTIDPESSNWTRLQESTIAAAGSFIGESIHLSFNTWQAVADSGKGQFTGVLYYYQTGQIIIDYSNFSASTGWTSVSNNVTFNAGGNPGVLVDSASPGGWNVGYYRNSPFYFDKGHEVTFTWQTADATDWSAITWLRTTGAITIATGTEGRGFNMTTAAAVNYFTTQNLGTFVTNLPNLVEDTLYDGKLVCNASTGFLEAYGKAHASGSYTLLATQNSDISASIYYFSDTNFSAFDLYEYDYLWTNGLAEDWAPLPPSGLSAAATGETTIDLEWTDNGLPFNEDGIKIERSLTSGSGFSEIDDVAQGTETFNDTGLDTETTYYYRVRSYFVHDAVTWYSAYSSEASATTDAPPDTSDPGGECLVLGMLD